MSRFLIILYNIAFWIFLIKGHATPFQTLVVLGFIMIAEFLIGIEKNTKK